MTEPTPTAEGSDERITHVRMGSRALRRLRELLKHADREIMTAWEVVEIAGDELVAAESEAVSLRAERDALQHGMAGWVDERIAPIQAERDRLAAQLRAVETVRVEFDRLYCGCYRAKIADRLAAALVGDVPPPAETGTSEHWSGYCGAPAGHLGHGKCNGYPPSAAAFQLPPNLLYRKSIEEHGRTERADRTVAHIVTASAAEIAASRLAGTTLTALCGTVWVPLHDNPADYPTCTRCVLKIIRNNHA